LIALGRRGRRDLPDAGEGGRRVLRVDRGPAVHRRRGRDDRATWLASYRWQYIGSGAQGQRFSTLLGSMITPAQGERIGAALAPLM
jgi:hypothetical protein